MAEGIPKDSKVEVFSTAEKRKKIDKKYTFSKIEEIKGRKIYHTKLFSDLLTGIDKNEMTKFFIALRSIYNLDNLNSFHIFPIKRVINF